MSDDKQVLQKKKERLKPNEIKKEFMKLQHQNLKSAFPYKIGNVMFPRRIIYKIQYEFITKTVTKKHNAEIDQVFPTFVNHSALALYQSFAQ